MGEAGGALGWKWWRTKLQKYVKKLQNVAKLIQNAAKRLKKLRLSGYFIQLLRYTAAVDGDIDT